MFIDKLRLGESREARSRGLRNEVVLAEEEVLAPQIAPPVRRAEVVEFVAPTVGHAKDVVDRRRAIVERRRLAVERDSPPSSSCPPTWVSAAASRVLPRRRSAPCSALTRR